MKISSDLKDSKARDYSHDSTKLFQTYWLVKYGDFQAKSHSKVLVLERILHIKLLGYTTPITECEIEAYATADEVMKVVQTSH